MNKNKSFDTTKVPHFICYFKNRRLCTLVMNHLVSLGYRDLMLEKDGKLSPWVHNFGNVESSLSKPNAALYHAYQRGEKMYRAVRTFDLDSDISDFLQFLEDSQKVVSVGFTLDGGVVSGTAYKDRVKFSRNVEFLNNKDLEIIKTAQAELD